MARTKTDEPSEKPAAPESWVVEQVPDERWPAILRSARATRTQTEVVTQVNERLGNAGPRLTQSVLSAWETGQRAPITSRDPFRQLLVELGLSSDGGHAIVVEARTVEAKLPGVVRDFQADVRETLAAPGGKVDIWLVGPTHLPILHSNEIRRLWAENLARGADYRIIWFTDKDVPTRSMLFSALENIAEHLEKIDSVQDRRGNIFHYPINLNAPMINTAKQWFQEAGVRGEKMFRRIEHEEVKISTSLNLILPLVEIVTPDMYLEAGEIHLSSENLNPLQLLSVRITNDGIAMTIRPTDNDYRSIEPILPLWLMVRRQWLDNWSIDSSLIFYHLHSDRETWLGAEHRSTDDIPTGEPATLEIPRVSSRTLLAFRQSIPTFRLCFQQCLIPLSLST